MLANKLGVQSDHVVVMCRHIVSNVLCLANGERCRPFKRLSSRASIAMS